MEAVEALRQEREHGTWSQGAVGQHVANWVNRLYRELDPQTFAAIERWVFDYKEERTRGSWDLAFPGLAAVLRSEPEGSILPLGLANAVQEAVSSTIDAGDDDWRSALAVVDELTPTERDAAGLVLESGSGLDPAQLVADALAVAITEDQVRRAWTELKRRTSNDRDIDAVVTAARSTADRMPNSRIPPDLIQRPTWI